MRNFQAVSHRDCGGEDVAPADHHNFVDAAFCGVLSRNAERRIEARRQHSAASDQTEITREDDIGAPVKHLADRLVRLAAHDYGAIEGKLAKTLKVRLQVPGQLTFAANDQVVADCCHEHDFHNTDDQTELPDIGVALGQYE